jgi:hypothetical protein
MSRERDQRAPGAHRPLGFIFLQASMAGGPVIGRFDAEVALRRKLAG